MPPLQPDVHWNRWSHLGFMISQRHWNGKTEDSQVQGSLEAHLLSPFHSVADWLYHARLFPALLVCRACVYSPSPVFLLILGRSPYSFFITAEARFSFSLLLRPCPIKTRCVGRTQSPSEYSWSCKN